MPRPAINKTRSRTRVETRLRLHVLDGAEELTGPVADQALIATAALAPLGYVLVIALDHADRVTMYRQSEWLPIGYADGGRGR
jgi:hypothetical protein